MDSFIHRLLPRQSMQSLTEPATQKQPTQPLQRPIVKLTGPLPWAKGQLSILERSHSAPASLTHLTRTQSPGLVLKGIHQLKSDYMHARGLAGETIIGADGLSYRLPDNKHTKVLDELFSNLSDVPTQKDIKTIHKHYLAVSRDVQGILQQQQLKDRPAIMEGLDNQHRHQTFTQCFYTQLKDIGHSRLGVSEAPEKKLQGEYRAGHIHWLAPSYSNYFREKPGLVDNRLAPVFLEPESTPIVNILVHGTFATSVTVNGWANPDGPQAKLISERFGGVDNPDHHCTTAFRWSGKNHREARTEAATELAKLIDEYQAKGIKVNLFAHSHGGNVVNEAIRKLGTDSKVNFLANLGTPVREDHRLTRTQVLEKVGYYVNVTGGKDPVAKAGGTDWVIPGHDLLSDEKAHFGLARRRDNAADFIIKITDAVHPDLYSLAVINQLRDPGLAQPTSSPDPKDDLPPRRTDRRWG